MKDADKKVLGLITAYGKAFGSREGRIVLKDLQENFFKHQSTFASDAIMMAHREGARGVILHIEQMIAQIKDKELMKQLLNPEEEENG